MRLISKILKYFIYHPLDRFIFYTAIKTNGKIYQLLFNLFSFLKKSPNKIYFKENYYYNTEVNWRFYHKKHVGMPMEKVSKKEKMNCCQLI